MNKYHYIVDTKLIAYYLIQRYRPITDIFNKLAELLMHLKKRGTIYACFDVGKSSYRLAEQSYYKGHRDTLRRKLGAKALEEHAKFNEDYLKLLEVFKRLNVQVLAIEGVEADDLASLLTEDLKKNPDNKITLITGDHDWLHMVAGTNKVRLFDFPQDQFWYTKTIEQAHGVTSRRQFSIKKSITGDKSDNIKFMKNLADVRGTYVYNDIYALHDDPTDEQIIEFIENFAENEPKIVVHPYHVQDGRTTIREAFLSNMKIADPFTDTACLTAPQAEVWKNIITHNHSETISAHDLDWFFINNFGYLKTLTKDAHRIFGVK